MMVVENARSLTYVHEPHLNDFQYETYGPNMFQKMSVGIQPLG